MTPNGIRPEIVRPTLRAGDTVPDFLQWSSGGPIRLHAWLGDGWGLVLVGPCGGSGSPFDRQRVEAIGGELARRGVRALVLHPHGPCRGAATAGAADLIIPGLEQAPVVVNPEPGVAAAFGLRGDGDAGGDRGATMPWAILIDPAKVVRAVIACPPAAGNPLGEIVQVLASIQGDDVNAWPWRGDVQGLRPGSVPQRPPRSTVQWPPAPVH